MQDARCRMQDARCKMQDARLWAFFVLALLVGGEDQGSNDFIQQFDTVLEYFRAEEAMATIVPAARFTCRAKRNALEIGIIFAKTTPMSFLDVGADRPDAADQLLSDLSTARFAHHRIRIFPNQVGEEQCLRVHLEVP